MLSSGPAWLSITLLITVSLLPDVLKKVLCRQLWPTAMEKTQVWRLAIEVEASHFVLSLMVGRELRDQAKGLGHKTD